MNGFSKTAHPPHYKANRGNNTPGAVHQAAEEHLRNAPVLKALAAEFPFKSGRADIPRHGRKCNRMGLDNSPFAHANPLTIKSGTTGGKFRETPHISGLQIMQHTHNGGFTAETPDSRKKLDINPLLAA